MPSLLNKLFRPDSSFGIALWTADALDFTAIGHGQPVLRLDIHGLWRWKPLLYQADPFLFVKGDRLYLFYEYQRWDDPGVLMMTSTDDLHTWTSPVEVLRERCHLSFPHVFEQGGEVYMIPETQALNEIRLYRGNATLTHFDFVRTLVSHPRTSDMYFNYCDSVLHRATDGTYYLFASCQQAWQYRLDLYVADDLIHGQFRLHPSSPVCVGNEFARCGGSLLNVNGRLLRVSQDCHASYGENVSLHEILALTPTAYEERLFQHNILPKGQAPYIAGGHQLHAVRFRDRYVIATDFKELHATWYQTFVRLKQKLGFCL